MSAAETISPFVAVALCTYNGAAFLRQQLDTILGQTYTPLEIVIVDDASTDETMQILEEYAKNDARIDLHRNETNLGFNLNFQKAIGLCKSEWIAIADQDDIWELNKIEMMLKHWPGQSLFVYSLSGSFSDSDFDHRSPAPKIYYDDISDTRKLVFNSPVHGHACMFKKELMQQCIPFPSDIFYDWWMSMHAADNGVIGCIPFTLTWHRVHSSNSSRTLTSIAQKEERLQQLRTQCAYFIEHFFSVVNGKPEERNMLLQYASMLRQCDGNTFSWPLFYFILKNRKLIFHYKRKPFAFVSHLKHAAHMAKQGLL